MSQTTIVVAALLWGFHSFVFVVVVAVVLVIVVVVVVVFILFVFLFSFSVVVLSVVVLSVVVLSVVVLSVVVFVEVSKAEYNFENDRLPMFLFLVEELFLFDGDFSNEYDEKISSVKKFQKSFKSLIFYL